MKLGGIFPETDVFVWPIRVRDRTVALLYGEPPAAASTAVLLSEPLKTIVDLIEQTFVRLIMAKKAGG